MFLRLIFFEVVLFICLYLLFKFFIDERYFGFMKILMAVAILLIGTQTAVLIFLSRA